MDIRQVLEVYDSMFGKSSLGQIDAFLEKKIEEAVGEGDVSAIITLVNEMIGFCRDTDKREKGISYCGQLIMLMRDLEMEGTVPYATSALNIANAYRAFGLLEEAMECYQTVETIYDRNLDKHDFRYASLYNNWSLLFQEMKEFEHAKKALDKALAVVTLYEDAKIEQATTHTNLAVTLLRLGETEEAQKHLEQGLEIYEKDGGKDFHYSAALSALGDACYLEGKLEEAITYYDSAMQKLEKHVGKTEAYGRIAENRMQAEQDLQAKRSAEMAERQRQEELRKAEERRKQEEQKRAEEQRKQEEQRKAEERRKQEEQKKAEELQKQEEQRKAEELQKQKEQRKIEELQQQKEQESIEEQKKVEELKEQEGWKETANLQVQSGLNLKKCREFYERYGAKMIHSLFPRYESQIAVGLVGEGSDCFGYDDFISKDHDYEIGFCIWIPEELNWTIGKPLEEAYQKLLRDTLPVTDQNAGKTVQGKQRRGVMTIGNFYRSFLMQSGLPNSLEEWEKIPEGALAAVTNGEVFRDDAGIFSDIRKKLKNYYPEEVFRYKLAKEITCFSQYGQYNYSRMMARQDYVTAKIALAEWMKYTMKIVYLLNRTYEPYYKWLRKGLQLLPILPELGDILDAVADMPDQRKAWKEVVYCAQNINGEDQIALTIEIVARYLLAELKRQRLTEGDDTYLASHAQEILTGRKEQFGKRKKYFPIKDRKVDAEKNQADKVISQKKDREENKSEELSSENERIEQLEEERAEISKKEVLRKAIRKVKGKKAEIEGKEKKLERKEDDSKNRNPVKSDSMELITRIVRLEWKQFEEVKNEGGKADCQKDLNTFQIMRKSQYLTWPHELLASYLADLIEAEEAGWNLMMEKYARMMETTAPDEYNSLKYYLPERTVKRVLLQEEVIRIQVKWMEEFSVKYPSIAGNARKIHTSQDTIWETSYETYLRGELGTYSDRTLELYRKFILETAERKESLAYQIMENTVRFYGYQSIEEAEEELFSQTNHK